MPHEDYCYTLEREVKDLRQQLTAAQDALENEQAKGIHSCHADCTMEGCVNRKLRQQLAAAHSSIADKTSHINWLNDHCSNGWDTADELSEQLSDSQKREVMLRDALEYCVAQVPELGTVPGIEEALAAAADLDGLILCHAEPCRDDGRCQYAIDHGAEGLGHCPEGKCCMQLYRAWEPKT